MKALILAGGLGTRLRPLVSDRPKPMAEVAGKPFLEYQVAQLRRQGFAQIVLCIGYLAEQVRDYFGDGRRWGVRIDYAVETERLGTAGAIRNAHRWIDDTFVVLNGDSYLETDFKTMVEYHRRQRATAAQLVGTIAAVAVDDVAAYGALELDGEGFVTRFREKGGTGTGWINGGVYVLEREILDRIPEGEMVSIEKETLPQLLAAGGRLAAWPAAGFFVDIGTPAGYHRFQAYAKEQDL
ncbi:MAG: nucleotidyltransferase family protein [Anaerolineae bacterium]|nr:nucleotidyltransferase family protein [Anaerolineae bacterium]